jgi:hypothetical protein
MPYIKADDRRRFERTVEAFKAQTWRTDAPVPSVGDLNYVITSICHAYVSAHGLCYATLNEVVGALECAKLEAYRTVVGPYEDTKIAVNGPISMLDLAATKRGPNGAEVMSHV